MPGSGAEAFENGMLAFRDFMSVADNGKDSLFQTLETKHTLKAVSRVSSALHYFAIGLSQNGGLSEETALIFVHRTLTDCLPLLSSAFEKKK